MSDTLTTDFGTQLRTWRGRRRMTQLDLSLASGVSTRHLSFLETGRSQPSRDMVLELAERLEVPLRERNTLLTSAGYAPAYPRRDLDAPELAAIRQAVEHVLRGHEPYPAIAVDRAWDVVSLNRPAGLFLEGVAPHVLEPAPNSYRISLHPDGLAPRIANLPELAHHLLGRLRHDAEVSGDPALAALLDEVSAYPTVSTLRKPAPTRGEVVVPVRLRHPLGELSLFTTVATFGTPVDVTVAELALETFFPTDEATGERLRQLAADASAT